MAPRQLLITILFLLALGLVIFLNQRESVKITTLKTTAKLGSEKRDTASSQSGKQQHDQPTVHQPIAQMTGRNTPYISLKKKPYHIDLKNREMREAAFLSDSPWRILVGISAILKKNGPVSNTEILGEINGYWLTDGVKPDLINFSQEKPMVVIDLRKNSVGIVTGVFTVVLKPGTQDSLLSQNNDLKILNSFPETNTYFVTAAQQPFDIEEFYFFLKNEFDAESVKAEVLSRHYEKN